MVVVYKVDRLTRALSDFARLVDVFDRRGVSFVSITQQFNTTTSMGRPTLNVLLSFAQFEREVIGERVRDKIAASKKKGMSMGGMPPLGYDVKDRKLVVNQDEAKIVIGIFQRYLALKSVRALQEALAEAGIRSKRRARPDGSGYGAQPLSRGALYLMLQNRLYRGAVSYKGHTYPGEHEAIVDEPLWDSVQATLAGNRVERATGARAKAQSAGRNGFRCGKPSPDPNPRSQEGRALPLLCFDLAHHRRSESRSGGRRIPADDLEGLVIDRLRCFLADPAAILDAIDEGSRGGFDGPSLIERGRRIADDLAAVAPDKVKATLMALCCRVEVGSNRIDITLSLNRLAGLLNASLDLDAQPRDQTKAPDDILRLRAPASLKRVGRGMRMLVENADDARAADPSLLRILSRAHDIQARLIQNPNLTVHDVARDEKVSSAHLYRFYASPGSRPTSSLPSSMAESPANSPPRACCA